MKGDMISRSAIKDQFEEYIAVGDKRFVEGMLHYRKIVLDAIDNAPTVVAAPVVHGRWIRNEAESERHIAAVYECSVCKNFEAWGETEKYTYCPNCGAFMDGGEGE